MNQPLDMLAFGAHPDDVEIGMAGTIIQHARRGARIGICDLTLAEMSSNGNVETRQQEAERASSIMGLSTRINLKLPDRGLYQDEEKVRSIVEVIRKYKPEIVFLPFPIDRHPDHGNCTRIVEEALFSSGIKKFTTSGQQEPHKVQKVFYYFINGYEHPTVTIDITDVHEQKTECLRAYESQFTAVEGGISTPLNNGYIESVIARDRVFGKESGVSFAEGFYLNRPLRMDSLLGEST